MADNDHYNFAKEVVLHVEKTAEQGNVSDILSCIDEYCNANPTYAMNVGNSKGKIIDEFVNECKPKTVLELGTFFGYGALLIGRMLEPDAMLYSLEISADTATVAKKLIEFAGMSEKIQVIVGDSSDVLSNFSAYASVSSFDFVFIDHWKAKYKPDVILLEKFNLIKKGSVIVADNVIYPGSPDYLEYVRGNPKYECTNHPARLNYKDKMDALEKSVYLG